MTIYKQPSEKIPVAVDFSKLLPSGQTLQAASDVKVYDTEGQDKTSQMLVSKTVGLNRIDAIIQGGNNNTTYNVEFQAVSQDYLFEEDVELVVRNTGSAIG